MLRDTAGLLRAAESRQRSLLNELKARMGACKHLIQMNLINKDHPFLNKFKQCFLTNVAVNYTSEGVYATYDDATPISMQLDLSFKEIEPIYFDDYDKSPTGVGF